MTRPVRIAYRRPEQIERTTPLNCPRCGAHSRARLEGSLETREDKLAAGVVEEYVRVLAHCLACDDSYLVTFSWSEWQEEEYEDVRTGSRERGAAFHVSTDPRSSTSHEELRELAASLNRALGNLAHEAVRAAANHLDTAAAMVIRAYLDRLTLVLGFPDGPLASRIQRLKSDGHVAPRLHGVLDRIVEAGHAAIHRAWTPQSEDVQAMLMAAEAVTSVVYVAELRDHVLLSVPERSPPGSRDRRPAPEGRTD